MRLTRLFGVLLPLVVAVLGIARAAAPPSQPPAEDKPKEQAKAAEPAKPNEPVKPSEPVKVDPLGDPMPIGSFARYGTVRLRHDAKAVAFLDDKTIVSVGSSIRFWDAATGKLIREHRSDQMANAASATISADGKRAVMRCNDERYRVWEIGTGKLIREFRSSTGNNFAFAMQAGDDSTPDLVASADGSRFVAREMYMDRNAGWGIRAVVYTLEGKTESIKMTTNRPDAGACGISPDGRQVVTTTDSLNGADGRQNLTFWDAATAKQVRVDKPNFGAVHAFHFMPGGKALVLNSEKGVMLRTLDGKVLWRSGNENESVSVACISAQCIVLTGVDRKSGQSEIRVLDAANGKMISHWSLPPEGASTATVSPDAKRLVFVNGASLHVVSLKDGTELISAPGHSSRIYATKVSSDGRFLASTDASDHAILLWDIATGQIVRRFQRSGASAQAVAMSPDGKLLAGTFSDLQVHVWEMASGREVSKLEDASRQSTGIRFLRDSERLAVVEATDFGASNVSVYQIPGGKVVREFLAPGQVFLDGLFYTTGERLLGVYSGIDMDMMGMGMRGRSMVIKGLDVWDIFAGRVVRHLDGFPGGYARATMSPDYRTLAVCAQDGTVRLWELASGQPRLTVRQHGRRGDSEESFQQLMFSPDGLTLAIISGGKPGVDFWDVPTGQRYGSLHGHDLPVTTLEFTRDGRRLLTGSEDSTILGWDLTRPEWRSRTLISSLSDKDVAMHWERLRNGTAEEAYHSKWALAGDPAKTVAFLQTRLPLRSPMPAERIKSWIADLDSSQYVVRERAQRELQSRFDQAEGSLHQALATPLSAEVRSRINRIIDANFAAIPAPDQLREIRALEVLEQIGSPEARELLRRLAASPIPTSTSSDAAQSLQRLESRPR